MGQYLTIGLRLMTSVRNLMKYRLKMFSAK